MQRFDSVEELLAVMARDVDRARQVLGPADQQALQP